jgi:protein gp37
MAETTKIEWADKTFSPWEGCQKVGPGCDHCYAESRNARFQGGNWGPGAPRRMMSDGYWRNPLRWNRQLAAMGERQTVFPSLCDPFDNAAPEGGRARFGALIEATPNLEWLLLTKRIGNAVDGLIEMFPNGVPSNVRVGATIVNHAEWLRDFPKMGAVRVAVGRRLFLSCEPLLGTIDLHAFGPIWGKIVGWVIAGGESGHEARPMHPDWVRSIRDQCATSGVPFLFKQWGEWAPREDGDRCIAEDGVHMPNLEPSGSNGDGTVRISRVGKKKSGRVLDGVQHDGFPA